MKSHNPFEKRTVEKDLFEYPKPEVLPYSLLENLNASVFGEWNEFHHGTHPDFTHKDFPIKELPRGEGVSISAGPYGGVIELQKGNKDGTYVLRGVVNEREFFAREVTEKTLSEEIEKLWKICRERIGAPDPASKSDMEVTHLADETRRLRERLKRERPVAKKSEKE